VASMCCHTVHVSMRSVTLACLMHAEVHTFVSGRSPFSRTAQCAAPVMCAYAFSLCVSTRTRTESGSVCCSALSSAYVTWGSHRFFPDMTYGDIVDVTCPSGHVLQGSSTCAQTFQVKCDATGGPAALTGGQISCVPFMCDEYQRVAPGNYSAPFTLCSHSSTCDASPGS
jgi:hypothetical protein